MKILTLNTWQDQGPWEERWEIIQAGLEQMKPDVACFQELFNRSLAGEIQKRTGFATLLFPEEYCGLAIFTDYPVSSWGIIRLTPSPLEDYLRYALWAELHVGRERLALINTHLSWKLEDGATRRKQAEEILTFIREKFPCEELVLVGDLNASPDYPEIQWLIREEKFRDLFRELHPNEPGFSWDNRNPYAADSGHELPDRRLDYVLARGRGPLLKEFISCDLVYTKPNAKGVWASDHFGVLAEFR